MSNDLIYETNDAPYYHTILLFSRSWIGTKLPIGSVYCEYNKNEDSVGEEFEIELLDTETNKIYKTTRPASYEQYWYETEHKGLYHVQVYCLLEHYCACHRKADVKQWVETDEKCEGDRFLIYSVAAPNYLPGVILYSEVLSDEQVVFRT